MSGEANVLSVFVLPIFTLIISGFSLFTRKTEQKITAISLVIGFGAVVVLIYSAYFPNAVNTAIFLSVISIGLLVMAFVVKVFRSKKR